MASDERTKTETEPIPFGAMERPTAPKRPRRKKASKKRAASSTEASKPIADDGESKIRPGRSGGLRPIDAAPQEGGPREDRGSGGERQRGEDDSDRKDWRKPQKRRGGARRGGRRRRRNRDGQGQQQQSHQGNQGEGGATATRDPQRPKRGRGQQGGQQKSHREPRQKEPLQQGSGMFVLEKGGFGVLCLKENLYIQSKQDIFVPQRLVQKCHLRDGALVSGSLTRGKKHKWQLVDVTEVDGKDPRELGSTVDFKSLTTIDPDFHYAVGDITGETAMRCLDILAPIGRGQRALIVAAPRTGKTTILRQFAKGIEVGYPEVHLMVLLVDERPEEATDWVRSTNGEVFVSTSDEMPKRHVQLAEAVWRRCKRLVELGEDVVLLLDSITRLARAYNNFSGGSGKTMSGGLDSRAMERPRQIFGSARNTETAGSLTIIGTTLVDTGSRMDQLIFEEFKGTGNSEVVLNRKLSDRRIFPAIDIEKSGTRKDEKLLSRKRLQRVNTLRRVLLRMNFIEAMELLSEKLEDVEKTDDFLQRFDVDPES